MFPIKDHNPSERTPYVTIGLIVINVLVYLYSSQLAATQAQLGAFYYDWASVPALVTDGRQTHTIITSMFLHAGLLHIGLNMLFLWIFGDNMEDAFGHIGFLLFYLASGIAANLAHVASAPDSQIPMIGASGAIAGVMGGYLLLFPRARIDVIVIFIIFFKRFTVPAWVMLIFWFALQLLAGIGSDPATGGVAYWAHIGGFAAGFLLTVPYWLRHHGPAYWRANQGRPPHPPGEIERVTTIPTVTRRRR